MVAATAFLALIVAGSALADGSPALQGSIVAQAATVGPSATVLAHSPVMFVVAPQGGFTFTITHAKGEILRNYAQEDCVGGVSAVMPGPLTCTYPAPTYQNQTVPLSDATVTVTEVRSGARAILSPGAASGNATLSPTSIAQIVPAAPQTVTAFPKPVKAGTETPYAYQYNVTAWSANISAAGGSLIDEGGFHLYVFGVSFTVTQGGANSSYESGITDVNNAGPVDERNAEKDVFVIDSGALQFSSLASFAFLAPAANLTVENDTVNLAHAVGSLSSGNGASPSFAAAGSDVALAGNGALTIAPIPATSPSTVETATGTRGPNATLQISVDGAFQPQGFLVQAAPARGFSPAVQATAVAAGSGTLLFGLWAVLAWRRKESAGREGLLEEAVLRLDAGDLQGALEKFNAAIACDPRNALLHLDRATCLERMGRSAEARRAFEFAVRCAPENGEAHYQFARSLAAAGLAPSAIAHLSKAFSLDPAFVQAARDDTNFRTLADHPTYQKLTGYYARTDRGTA
ncbi:MAG: TPR end-of-group domain-containing protein [Thermoplasmatota archaeon]